MSKEVADTSDLDMMIWRPILCGMATYTDVANMSVSEIYDLHEALDIKEALEKEARELAKNNKG